MKGKVQPRQQYRTYTSGNTARVLQPISTPREQDKHDNVFIARSAARSAARKKSNNFGASAFLFMAVIITLAFCIIYLYNQISVQGQAKNVAQLEKLLANVQNENGILEEQLSLAVNLDEVYKIATEELGMTYPNKEQILSFTKEESLYVTQFDSIPTLDEETTSFLGIVIKGR